MKKLMKLVPAFIMLLVSAILVSTATFAWFSMNTQVTATNMQVKAVAEDGIVISNIDRSGWSNTANAKITTANLVPTSVAAVASPVFVHATSPDSDDPNANQAATDYATLDLTWSNSGYGEGFVDLGATPNGTKDDNEKSYVLANAFYIKSSGDALTLGADKTYKDLYINNVTVSGATNAIDNALRVLVVVGSTAYIYAPVKNVDGGTTTLSYTWKGTTAVAALDATVAAGYNKTTGTTSIGNTDATAVLAKVYVYFEGEDANCFSDNISGITTTNLNVSVQFGITTITTP